MMPFSVVCLQWHVTSWHNPFESRFCTSKKGRIGGDVQAYSRHSVHMVAALAAYRITLVATHWTSSHLVGTNRCRNPLLSSSRGTISGAVGSFRSGGLFAGQRALTIESSLINGCGQPPQSLA